MKETTMKIIVSIVAIFVALGGLTTFLVYFHNPSGDATAIVLARANTEGSGIFGDDPAMVTIEDGIAVFHPEKWEHKTIAHPGATSIQYLFIKKVIQDMGLNALIFDSETPCPDGSVYLKESAIAGMPTEYNERKIDGGIAWEPIYSKTIIETSAYGLCTTDQLPGRDNHACCMVAGNNRFVENNREAIIGFLAGYIKAVDYINANKNSSDPYYNEIIQMAVDFTEYSEDVVKDAMANVNYTYNLTDFTLEFANLIDDYIAIGNIRPDAMSKIGQTPSQFANAHVDGTLLEAAKEVTGPAGEMTIRVAYLAKDIHQFALVVGMEKGFFAEYGISIEKVGPFAAGGAVVNALLTGEADLGFAGAPPIVLNTVNMAAGA